MSLILGIDPGSRITGLGIIESRGSQNRWVHHERLECGDGSMSSRLQAVFQGIGRAIRHYHPDEVAIENVFVHRNPASALVLGQARGAAMCAVAEAGVALFEYPPAQIKMAVVGRGRAEKHQVAHMVKVLLNLREAPTADAADALAVAICHAHNLGASSGYAAALARAVR